MNINEPQSTIPGPTHPWEKFLPSKRIQKVLLVIFIILLGYTLWKPVTNLVKKITTKTTTIITPTIPKPVIDQVKPSLSIDKDTDGDGLADWQETLIGTDPEIPNSESEVPKELREIIVEKTSPIVTSEDKLALNIYQRLLSNPVGNDINQAIQAATTKEVLDLANTLEERAPQYSYEDLDLVDLTNESKTSYQKQIQSVQKTSGPPSRVP
jgi:hypothetical protein